LNSEKKERCTLNQEQLWKSDFGARYTERNIYSKNELDEAYKLDYGITRTQLNEQFLKEMNIESILEIGCNVGNQLRVLQTMGYEKLYGIELQQYAVEKAKELTKGINIIQANAFDVPFRDQCFNLVFTSGVLIHISPDNLPKIMSEMYRMTNRYIWGFEYYADQLQEINYRGHDQAMWKADYAKMFMDMYPDLQLVKFEKVNYVNSQNVDVMYLLEKKG
jgi:pseudaminic acid biosynthesis-associated methylase